jgi:hypothetical protein
MALRIDQFAFHLHHSKKRESISMPAAHGPRSFDWLKHHPLIPIAIAGILAAAYFLAPSSPELIAQYRQFVVAARETVDRALSQACRSALIGFKGIRESDVAANPSAFISGEDLICQIRLTAMANEKLLGGGILHHYESISYPLSKIPSFVRPFFADQGQPDIHFHAHFGP